MRIATALTVAVAAVLAAPTYAGTEAANPVKAAPQVAAPAPGMGQVVFYRPSAMGALVSCRVYEAGKVVNRLPPGKYFVQQTTPGVHEYSVKSEATDRLRINVEEGETQYARCAIGMGFMSGRPNLSTQNREDFDKRGKHLKAQAAYEEKELAKN